MNSNLWLNVKAINSLKLTLFFFLIVLTSCSKDGDDYINNSGTFPLNWKSYNQFDLVAYNAKDTLRAFRNTSIVPFGTIVDGKFGTFRSSFYASYQTTLTSKTFSFASIDSVALILPYSTSNPIFGNPSSISIEVYELLENLSTDPNNTRINYQTGVNLLGSKSNFALNFSDSLPDLGGNLPPAIRIPLNMTLGTKLIQPGSYANDADLQAVFKGLYVKSASNVDNNGFLFLDISTQNILRIYGKNSAGANIYSDFQTGGTNSTTINQFAHDNQSAAQIATNNANTTLGDQILYNHGLSGFYNKITLPRLDTFVTNKNIFKAELSIYSIDTGIQSSTFLGLLVEDSTGKEFVVPDELYEQSYLISVKDTTIAGISCIQYKYNVGMFINRVAISQGVYKSINIYSAPISISNNSITKLSDYLPSRLIIGGTGHVAKPQLKLFYTDK